MGARERSEKRGGSHSKCADNVPIEDVVSKSSKHGGEVKQTPCDDQFTRQQQHSKKFGQDKRYGMRTYRLGQTCKRGVDVKNAKLVCG